MLRNYVEEFSSYSTNINTKIHLSYRIKSESGTATGRLSDALCNHVKKKQLVFHNFLLKFLLEIIKDLLCLSTSALYVHFTEVMLYDFCYRTDGQISQGIVRWQ